MGVWWSYLIKRNRHHFRGGFCGRKEDFAAVDDYRIVSVLLELDKICILTQKKKDIRTANG